MKKIHGYKVEAPKNLLLELLENSKNGYIINWFNFNPNDIFYSDNGEEYHIRNIDHKLKSVTLV